MQSCSKAPWGLFVLARQCPHDYSIRAGLNLPDKEFRYLRTIIVIAAVHRGFSLKREPLPLTFRHRAGVSPYTSAFALAETCVFGKQFRGLFSCGLLAQATKQTVKRYVSDKNLLMKKIHKSFLKLAESLGNFFASARRQSLFRSYGRYFAEFLSEGSLVGLSLLDSSTGVGLRYGRQKLKINSFSSQSLPQNRYP